MKISNNKYVPLSNDFKKTQQNRDHVRSSRIKRLRAVQSPQIMPYSPQKNLMHSPNVQVLSNKGFHNQNYHQRDRLHNPYTQPISPNNKMAFININPVKLMEQKTVQPVQFKNGYPKNGYYNLIHQEQYNKKINYYPGNINIYQNTNSPLQFKPQEDYGINNQNDAYFPQGKFVKNTSLSKSKIFSSSSANKRLISPSFNRLGEGFLKHSKILSKSHDKNLADSRQNENSIKSQQFSGNIKIKRSKLKLKSKKQQETTNQQTNQKNHHQQYTIVQNQYFTGAQQFTKIQTLQPHISFQNERHKKTNYLRLSKSMQNHLKSMSKLQVHSSRGCNNINFDKMYDQQDFQTNKKSQQRQLKNDSIDNSSIQNQQKSIKRLTSMQSQLKSQLNRRRLQGVKSKQKNQVLQMVIKQEFEEKTRLKVPSFRNNLNSFDQTQNLTTIQTDRNYQLNKLHNQYMVGIDNHNLPVLHHQDAVIQRFSKIQNYPYNANKNGLINNSQFIRDKSLSKVGVVNFTINNNNNNPLKVITFQQIHPINYASLHQQHNYRANNHLPNSNINPQQIYKRPHSSISQFTPSAFINSQLSSKNHQINVPHVVNLHSKINRPQSQSVETLSHLNINSVIESGLKQNNLTINNNFVQNTKAQPSYLSPQEPHQSIQNQNQNINPSKIQQIYPQSSSIITPQSNMGHQNLSSIIMNMKTHQFHYQTQPIHPINVQNESTQRPQSSFHIKPKTSLNQFINRETILINNNQSQSDDNLPIDSKPNSPQHHLFGRQISKVQNIQYHNFQTDNQGDNYHKIQNQYHTVNNSKDFNLTNNIKHKFTQQISNHRPLSIHGQVKSTDKQSIHINQSQVNMHLKENHQSPIRQFYVNGNQQQNIQYQNRHVSHLTKQQLYSHNKQIVSMPYQNQQSIHVNVHNPIQRQNQEIRDSVRQSHKPSLVTKIDLGKNTQLNSINTVKFQNNTQTFQGNNLLAINSPQNNQKVNITGNIYQTSKSQQNHQSMSPPSQQWLNINRQKYSTSEYLNMDQLNKKLQVEQQLPQKITQHGVQQHKIKNQFITNQQHALLLNSQSDKNKYIKKIKQIQEEDQKFRQKIYSISQTVLQMTPIKIEKIEKIEKSSNQKQNNQKQHQYNQHDKFQTYQAKAESFDNQYSYSSDEESSRQDKDLTNTRKIKYTYKSSKDKNKNKNMKKQIQYSNQNSDNNNIRNHQNLSIKNVQSINSQDQQNPRQVNPILISNSNFTSDIQSQYHKLPKPSFHDISSNKQIQEKSNSQKIRQNHKKQNQNKLLYTPIQSEQIIQMSSLNSLSFQFVNTNYQPSTVSNRQGQFLTSSKNVHMEVPNKNINNKQLYEIDTQKKIKRDKEKQTNDGKQDRVQNKEFQYYGFQDYQQRLYNPIPYSKQYEKDMSGNKKLSQNKQFEKRNVQVNHQKHQNVRKHLSQQNNQKNNKQKTQQSILRSSINPSILKQSLYGIAQDSVNYVPIQRHISESKVIENIHHKQLKNNQHFQDNDSTLFFYKQRSSQKNDSQEKMKKQNTNKVTKSIQRLNPASHSIFQSKYSTARLQYSISQAGEQSHIKPHQQKVQQLKYYESRYQFPQNQTAQEHDGKYANYYSTKSKLQNGILMDQRMHKMGQSSKILQTMKFFSQNYQYEQ